MYLIQLSEGQGASIEALERRGKVVIEEVSEKASELDEMEKFDRQARAVEASLKTHITWLYFFEIIESRTKPNVKYLSFIGDADSGIISLSAIGRSYRDVAEQIVALREHPQVKKVATSGASALINELGEVTGVTFSMVITMDLSAWRPGLASAQTQ